ncbi:hypothetical protein Tco_0541511 [Tanacetum coccineum]
MSQSKHNMDLRTIDGGGFGLVMWCGSSMDGGSFRLVMWCGSSMVLKEKSGRFIRCYTVGAVEHITSTKDGYEISDPQPCSRMQQSLLFSVPREGVGLHMANSHAGNHPEGGFKPFETIQRLLVVIGRRSHSGFEWETFKPERRSLITSTCEVPQLDSCMLALWRYVNNNIAHNILLSFTPEVIIFLSSLSSACCASISERLDKWLSLLKVTEKTYSESAFSIHNFCLSKYPQLLLDENKLDLKSFKDKLPPNIDENLYFQRLGRYPKSVRGKEMDFKNFIYTKDDDDLAFLLKEPSPGFGIGSPSTLVNTEPPKDVDEPKVQPAEVTAYSGESSKAGVFVVHRGSVVARIKERKCKTRGGSSRPPVKRKLAFESSSSRAVRAKTSTSKDDAPFLSISDDDEGPQDCFELKDANVCHLKISSITPPAWRVYFDNQMDLELPDLHDRCYARQDVVDNIVNRRASAMAEFDQNPAVLALQEKISSLTADDKEHKGNLDRMMLESQKWAGHQVTLSTLELKVNSLEADKAKLEAVEASLRGEVEELKQEKRDVVSKVVPYATKAYEQVAAMKEPFDLSKVKGYRSSYQKEHTQASNDFATATFH